MLRRSVTETAIDANRSILGNPRSAVRSKGSSNCKTWIKQLGQSDMAQDFDRQIAVIQVHITVPNLRTSLWLVVAEAVETRSGKGVNLSRKIGAKFLQTNL